MTDSKVSDLATRSPQASDLLLLSVTGSASYKAAVSTLANVFYPEWYGAAGDGTTDDTAAVQSAIDAASVSGGTVKLAQTYAIAYTATQSMAGYSVAYGLWVNADNVCIEGPGTLVPYTSGQGYTLLVFGNGGAPNSHPGEAGDWTLNVGCTGLNFDGTGFDANGVSAIQFTYCKGFYATNCHFRNVSGRGVFGLATQRYGRIVGNTIDVVAAAGHTLSGIYLDGGSYCLVTNNYIGGCNGIGIVIQSNIDNGAAGTCKYNRISENVINDPYSIGIQLEGVQCSQVHNNYISDTAASVAAIRLRSYASALGKVESSWNSIVGNYLFRSNTGGTAIQCLGYDANAFDGTPLPCRLNFLATNYIDDQFAAKISIGQQAGQNIIADNVWDTVGTFTADDATPSVSGGFNVYKTANANPTTVTMLDGGYTGQRVTIIIDDANTTIDFTGTNLKGNGGADWSPAGGDFMVCTFDGTDWYCEVHTT